ncbi:FAD-binding domain-containing protein [Sanghuangporus baumii]|uniref:FAD-binding domain-containing protein n=1 Tax=Sanghuangporus baumii TaxID=108892 RepID=A0A9Q5I360_SANBA|nr:FAD-binding domain-containing protein [Sanghuangporus baumii]
MAPNPALQESSLLFSTPTFRALENNLKGDINAVRRAKIVAFVKDANDAPLAVKCAREPGLPLAIRGGRHSPAGSSSSEGIVIDLSRYVNECRVDPERKLAYVGGGAIWKTVDETATTHGLATVGGTVNHTGVGGPYTWRWVWMVSRRPRTCGGQPSAGPSDATGEVPYEQMNSLQNSNFPHGRNYYFQGAIQNHYSAAAAKKAFERVCEVSLKDVSIVLGIELYPLRKVNSIPKDAMAFNLRGAESNIFSLAAWDDDSYEAALRGKEAAHAVTQSISISEERPKTSSVMAYGNYLGDEKLSSERSLKVFGENYPRLQQLKKKYDPDMLFSKWFKIVPA